jgi:hypothetical protein
MGGYNIDGQIIFRVFLILKKIKHDSPWNEISNLLVQIKFLNLSLYTCTFVVLNKTEKFTGLKKVLIMGTAYMYLFVNLKPCQFCFWKRLCGGSFGGFKPKKINGLP